MRFTNFIPMEDGIYYVIEKHSYLKGNKSISIIHKETDRNGFTRWYLDRYRGNMVGPEEFYFGSAAELNIPLSEIEVDEVVDFKSHLPKIEPSTPMPPAKKPRMNHYHHCFGCNTRLEEEHDPDGESYIKPCKVCLEKAKKETTVYLVSDANNGLIYGFVDSKHVVDFLNKIDPSGESTHLTAFESFGSGGEYYPGVKVLFSTMETTAPSVGWKIHPRHNFYKDHGVKLSLEEDIADSQEEEYDEREF